MSQATVRAGSASSLVVTPCKDPRCLMIIGRRTQAASRSFQSERVRRCKRLSTLPRPMGGVWTGPNVAVWIKEQTGREVHPQRGWEYLRRLNDSTRVLRPRQAKADPEEQEAFTNNVRSWETRSSRPILSPASNGGLSMSIASASSPCSVASG